MPLSGLRKRVQALASSGGDAARDAAREAKREAPDVARDARAAGRSATGAVARRAPETGLERNRQPAAPGSREAIAQRLQGAGQMRKPIEDANLEPGADPRYLEAFGRGDADTGAWFGEDESGGDALTSYFARGSDGGMTFGPFVEEMLDERDHEGGHYAYEDEREEGLLDDGVSTDGIVSGVSMRW